MSTNSNSTTPRQQILDHVATRVAQINFEAWRNEIGDPDTESMTYQYCADHAEFDYDPQEANRQTIRELIDGYASAHIDRSLLQYYMNATDNALNRLEFAIVDASLYLFIELQNRYDSQQLARPIEEPPTMEIIPANDETALAVTNGDLLAQVSHAANIAAAQTAIVEYLDRKSDNTIRTHSDSMKRFAVYLNAIAPNLGAEIKQFALDMLDYRTCKIAPDIDVWRNVSHGLIKGFREWMKSEGDAIATINARLSALKVLASVAFESEVIDETTHALTRAIKGYSRKEAKRVNERREITRRGAKKAEHTSISDKQAGTLKTHPDTPQGRRDTLLMCLLLDHGYRAGEVAGLLVDGINFADKTITLYREKVDKMDTQDLSDDTHTALIAYQGDMPIMVDQPLLRASKKGGALTDAGITTRSLTKRVKTLGEEIGIDRLSAHDCRHYWASYWGKRVDKLPKGLFTLQEAGGWASLAMPRRYVELAQISNEGMV